MLRTILAAMIGVFSLVAPAFAQDEEIVVTARRYREAYENFSMPHIARVLRADYAVQNLTISSDTRDANQRRDELRQALQGLNRFANRDAAISVALIEEDEDDSGQARVVGFTVDKAMELLRAGGRPDTSQITIVVRTRIAASDDRDAVEQRFDDFASHIQRPGRVEVGLGDTQLTLTDPQQYRTQLVSDIAADAARVSAALGDGYGARLEGLENPIAWRRAGDLDLRLFIPYRMIILPRDAN